MSRSSHGVSRLSRTEKEKEKESSASYEAGVRTPFGAVVVREYLKSGGTADRQELAILGANAKRLRSKGASESDILAAVREYAQTKRWPRYISEWTTEKQNTDEIERWQKEKETERRHAPQAMQSLAEQLRKAGLVA